MAALAMGLSARSVHAAPQPGSALATVRASMDHDRAARGHEGCPLDHKADVHGACSSACAGMSVLAPAIATTASCFVGQGVVRLPFDLAMVGHAYPPDPYPPKV